MTSRIDNLANEILQHAAAHGLTVCTAESCSAGRLATAFARGEGASESFHGGIVAYTKDAKVRLLGVSPDLILEGTAVCGAVAEAMALGALRRSEAALGVSVTGVAGPNPDEDGNPVGLVFCGAARSDGETKHLRLDLEKADPDAIIDEACVAALNLLRSFSFS